MFMMYPLHSVQFVRSERLQSGDGGAGGRVGKVRRQVPQQGDEVFGIGVAGRRFRDQMARVGFVGAGRADLEEDGRIGRPARYPPEPMRRRTWRRSLPRWTWKPALGRKDALDDAGVAEGRGPDAGGGEQVVETRGPGRRRADGRSPADVLDVGAERGQVLPAGSRRRFEEGGLGPEQGLGRDPQAQVAFDRALERGLEEAAEDDRVAAVEGFRVGVEVGRGPAHVDEGEVLPARDALGDRPDELEYGQGRRERIAAGRFDDGREALAVDDALEEDAADDLAGGLDVDRPDLGHDVGGRRDAPGRARISTTWSRTLRLPA